MKWLLIAAIFLAVAGAIYVRTVSHDTARWHVDPATVIEVQDRNQHLGRAVFEGLVPLGDMLTEMLKDDSNVDVLAGSVEEGWVTYVVRTPLIGFPDYVSVRMDVIDPNKNPRARIAIYSRSRFGHSDLGANKARVEAWILALKVLSGER